MRQFFFVAAALLIAGCADQAPAPTPVVVASANATPAAAPASSGQTCRKESVIGSNLPQLVCHSNSGDIHDAATDQAIRDVQRSGSQQIQGIHH